LLFAVPSAGHTRSFAGERRSLPISALTSP
jgi:hypothetical protein